MTVQLAPKGQLLEFADMNYKIRPVNLHAMEKENFKTGQAYLKKNQLEFLEIKSEIRYPMNS